jgi:hypothetical protein
VSASLRRPLSKLHADVGSPHLLDGFRRMLLSEPRCTHFRDGFRRTLYAVHFRDRFGRLLLSEFGSAHLGDGFWRVSKPKRPAHCAAPIPGAEQMSWLSTLTTRPSLICHRNGAPRSRHFFTADLVAPSSNARASLSLVRKTCCSIWLVIGDNSSRCQAGFNFKTNCPAHFCQEQYLTC